jgi:hypothetical protein
MSCLYSSPEVTSVELLVLKSIALKLQALKLQASDCRRHRRLARSGTPHARPDRGAVRFQTDFAVRRRQQRRVPQQPSGRRWLYQVIPPAKAQVLCVAFQAQYQAFVRFAVKAAQLSKAIALNQDLRFGTFHSGRALALRTLASTRSIYGEQPWTDVVTGR